MQNTRDRKSQEPGEHELHSQIATDWTLTNTDVDGILASIKPWLASKRDPKVFVLGAGGSAAAVVYSLASECAVTDITVACREPRRAHQTCLRLAKTCLPLNDAKQALAADGSVDERPTLVVNTLPLGHHGEPNPAAQMLIEGHMSKNPQGHLFFDLIYRTTPAILQAQSRGIPAINGELMLRTQAAQSFTLWTASQALS